MIRPIKNSTMKAMPILPTSPAKHQAFPFGRKLKKANTRTERIVTKIKDGVLYSS